MGVTAQRGRKNDEAEGRQSVNRLDKPLCRYSPGCFFMQSRQNKGLYPTIVDLQKGNCIQVSWAGPSISTQDVKSDIWGHLCWLVPVLTSCD